MLRLLDTGSLSYLEEDFMGVVEDLKRCRELLDGVLKELDVKKYTLDDVRRALVEKSKNGKQAEVKALLLRHGAERLSDIPETEYEAMMKEASEIA